MSTGETGRYTVVRHADEHGYWYSVIDQQVHRKNLTGDNIVAVYRSRNSAHRRAGSLNAAQRSASGSEWFHAGMPS